MLPEIKIPEYSLVLPISKKTITYRPYVMRHEKIIASMEGEAETTFLNVMFKILKECIVDEDIDLYNIPLIDFMYICIHIRSKSKGDEVKSTLKCPECKHETDFAFNIKDAIGFKNQDVVSIIFNVNENLSLELQPISTQIFRRTGEEISNEEYEDFLIASAIKTVIFEKKVYRDFTVDDLLEKIISKLPKIEIEKMLEKMSEMITMHLNIKVTCSNQECKRIETKEVSNIVNFL